MTDIAEKDNVLSIIFESTHMLVAYLDADLRFVQVNRAYAEADNKTPDYFVGKKHFELYPNEENEAIFRRVIETGKPHFSYAKPFEYEHNPERGVTHWDWSAVPSKDDDGKVTGVVMQLINVTERIQAEEAKQHAVKELALNEETMANAQSIAHIGTWDWNIQADELIWSDEIFNIFGESRDEFGATYQHFLERVHDEDRAEVDALVKRAIADPETNYRIEHRIVRANGDVRYVKESGKVYFDGAGKAARMIGIIQDVTEQKLIQLHLTEQSELLGKAEEIAHVGCWNWNIVTNELGWTDEIYRMLGYEPQSFPADFQKFSDLIHPDDREEALAAVMAAVEDPAVEYNIEHRIVREDGSVITVRERGEVHRDEAGKPSYMIGIAQDITERKKTEEELRSKEQQWRAFVNGTFDGILIADVETRKFTFANQAMVKLLGWEADEFTDLGLADIHPAEDLEWLSKDFVAMARGEVSRVHDAPLVRKDGSVIYAEISGSPLQLDGRNYIIGLFRDTSEQRKAEAALRANQAQLASFFSQSLDGFFFMMLDEPIDWNAKDADRAKLLEYAFTHQHMTKINDAMLQQYGGSREQFIGLTPNDFFEHDIEYGQKLWQKLFSDGRLVIKTEEQKLDGTPMWIEGEYVCMYDEQGRITGHFGVQREVTEQVQMQNEVRVSEARLKEAQRIAKIGSWELNLETNHLFWTNEIYNLFEIDKKKFGASYEAFLDAIHPEDRGAVNAAYTKSLEDRQPYEITHRLRMADGRIKWVEERCWTEFSEEGKPLVSTGTVQDITDRHYAEEELRQFKTTLDQTSDCVFMFNAEDLQFTYVNQGAMEQIGYALKDMLRLTPVDIKPDYDEKQFREMIAPLIDHPGSGIRFETRHQRKDGHILPVEIYLQYIAPAGEEPRFVAVVRDITDRKQQEAELEKYREHLEDLVAERTRDLVAAQNELVRKERLATLGQLTATVSHELRNPLGAMRPSLFLVQKANENAGRKVQQALERLDRNISRCDHIIDELLDFTRITVLDRDDVNVDDWVEQLLLEQAIPAGIKVVHEPGLARASAQIDANRLRRALINIIENGIQAMQDDGRDVQSIRPAELTIFTRDLGDDIEIGVRDTGSGIPDDVLPHVFEPLYSTKGFGVGLGMPTVQQIIKQHGGDINIDTAIGAGTTVRFTIPKKAEEVEPEVAGV